MDGGRLSPPNPTVAAIVEALKRTESPGRGLRRHDLLVVSLGTGHHEVSYKPSDTAPLGRGASGSCRGAARTRR